MTGAVPSFPGFLVDQSGIQPELRPVFPNEPKRAQDVRGLDRLWARYIGSLLAPAAGAVGAVAGYVVEVVGRRTERRVCSCICLLPAVMGSGVRSFCRTLR